MAKWKDCDKHQPNNERQVVVARPDRTEVEAARYLRPENVWVEAGTNIVIHPSLWTEMPASPWGIE